MDEKRLYIYENIYKINDHTNLINLINSSKCKYTENSNGLFINLNTLDDNIIKDIYFLIYNEINTEIKEYTYEKKLTTINKSEYIIKPKEILISNFFLNEFNKQEINIIEKSKIYKL